MKSSNIYDFKNGNIFDIEKAAESDLPIDNLNALLFGTKYKIKTHRFISAIKNKMLCSKASFFGVPMKKYAIAALDVLDIDKYSGKYYLYSNKMLLK